MVAGNCPLNNLNHMVGLDVQNSASFFSFLGITGASGLCAGGSDLAAVSAAETAAPTVC